MVGTWRFFSLLTLMVLAMSCNKTKKPVQSMTLFVGTYTDGASEGIYTLQFHPESGSLDSMKLAAKLDNPSFLAISKDKNHLYAVQETADFDSLGGGITAFKLKDGLLQLQNSRGTQGAHPCHVALSGDGQLAVSNYTGGNLAIFNLESDGSLQADPQVIDHKVLDTTKTAHVHKAHFNEEGLFASDLGLDKVKRYGKKGDQWGATYQDALKMDEGAGPRHFTFSKNRNFLYVINELNATINVFQKDAKEVYQPIQTVSTLAPDWQGVKSCADIHLSPDGKFLYGSNRGENTLVIFAVDAASGKLNLVDRKWVRGDWPRNFTLSPDGNYILVANQKSDNITVFKRDPEKGTLLFVGKAAMPAPVCLVFLE